MLLLISIFPLLAMRADVERSGDSLGMTVEPLEITDPSKIHIRELPSKQELLWRFRVYVPPSDDVMLQASEGRGGSGVSWPKVSDPVPLTVAIVKGPLRHRPEVRWHLLIEFGGRRNAVALSPAQVKRITQQMGESKVNQEVIIASPKRPVKIKTFLPSVPGHFAEEFSGVEVWLERSK